MTPKERRDRLFRNGRPKIRPLGLIDGEEYSRDIKILWVAHTKKPWQFMTKDVSQEEFINRIIDLSGRADFCIADDNNTSYESGSGPIGVCWIFDNGWKVEPHAEFFPWATSRNILRVTVSFLHMMKYKRIGVCMVYSLKNSVALFNKCTKYGVLFRNGMIPGGDQRGDEYVYSIRGKR